MSRQISGLADIWSYQKRPWRHLVYVKRSLKFDPIKNTQKHIGPTPNGPSYLVLSKTSTLRKHVWVRSIIIFILLVTYVKNSIMFYWSSMWCGCTANNNPSRLGRLARGVRQMGGVGLMLPRTCWTGQRGSAGQSPTSTSPQPSRGVRPREVTKQGSRG